MANQQNHSIPLLVARQDHDGLGVVLLDTMGDVVGCLGHTPPTLPPPPVRAVGTPSRAVRVGCWACARTSPRRPFLSSPTGVVGIGL